MTISTRSTIVALKTSNMEEIQAITQHEYSRVINNFANRIQQHF